MPIKSTLALLLVVLLATASGCSGSPDEPTPSPTVEPTPIPTSTPRPLLGGRGIATFSISAERGASFSYFNDTLAMEIAPGALPDDTDVKVSPIDISQVSNLPFEYAEVGIVFDVDPSDLYLNEAALVTLSLDAEMIGAPVDGEELPEIPLVLVSELGSREPLEISSSTWRDDGRLAVSTEIRHFGRIYQLKASAAASQS